MSKKRKEKKIGKAFADGYKAQYGPKKPTHGGKRKGAGRPKTKEDTKVMRVPVSKVDEVKNVIKK